MFIDVLCVRLILKEMNNPFHWLTDMELVVDFVLAFQFQLHCNYPPPESGPGIML